jgi:hypothetical protein
MPCVSGNYDPHVGVLINCAVFPQSQLAAFVAPLAPGGSPPNVTMFMGLIDTGASATCISAKVVASLVLQPSGKTTLSGSTGQSDRSYTFVVGFIFGAQQAPTGAVSGQLIPHLVQGCEFTSHGFGFDLLIGRDILCKGALSLSFDGHYTLSF